MNNLPSKKNAYVSAEIARYCHHKGLSEEEVAEDLEIVTIGSLGISKWIYKDDVIVSITIYKEKK